jgi:deoxyribodipyrimidine photo-lyase
MNIVWLRRSLRLEDNLVLQQALLSAEPILMIFIFDSRILARFSNKNDRRLSFLASSLKQIDSQLQQFDAKLNIFYGDSTTLVPQIVASLKDQGQEVNGIYVDEDFEPNNIERDNIIAATSKAPFFRVCDHLLIRPGKILTGAGTPFKVFTPFSKAFISYLAEHKVQQASYDLKQIKWAKQYLLGQISFNTEAQILEPAGYNFAQDSLWPSQDGALRLKNFIASNLADYKEQRDFMGTGGTSSLSPYLRFGRISIRQCFLASYDKPHSQTWVNELLWREFYANVLYHFPHTQNKEFLSQYQGKIPWRRDQYLLDALVNSRTGFPIVDSAMAQLIQDGWMHNRSRMIVASFASKNMLLDWRLGDELFAQYLMDYDLASNIGGWQWSGSCGTDAQPYFRIFNPMLQSLKFDAQGVYIKKYLPMLQKVQACHIHENALIRKHYPEISYPEPVVDYYQSRMHALEVFSLKH